MRFKLYRPKHLRVESNGLVQNLRNLLNKPKAWFAGVALISAVSAFSPVKAMAAENQIGDTATPVAQEQVVESEVTQSNDVSTQTLEQTQSAPAPVQEESAPASSVSEPVQGESAPVSSVSEPVQGESAPASSVSEPVQGESAPASSVSEPVQEESAPASSVSEPVQEESAPTQTESAPAIEETEEKISEETEEKVSEETEEKVSEETEEKVSEETEEKVSEETEEKVSEETGEVSEETGEKVSEETEEKVSEETEEKVSEETKVMVSGDADYQVISQDGSLTIVGNIPEDQLSQVVEDLTNQYGEEVVSGLTIFDYDTINSQVDYGETVQLGNSGYTAIKHEDGSIEVKDADGKVITNWQVQEKEAEDNQEITVDNDQEANQTQTEVGPINSEELTIPEDYVSKDYEVSANEYLVIENADGTYTIAMGGVGLSGNQLQDLISKLQADGVIPADAQVVPGSLPSAPTDEMKEQGKTEQLAQIGDYITVPF